MGQVIRTTLYSFPSPPPPNIFFFPFLIWLFLPCGFNGSLDDDKKAWRVQFFPKQLRSGRGESGSVSRAGHIASGSSSLSPPPKTLPPPVRGICR